jgi:hypothetical protein
LEPDEVAEEAFWLLLVGVAAVPVVEAVELLVAGLLDSELLELLEELELFVVVVVAGAFI